MKERILKFLQAENLSSSQFAELIGVQPSSISHIVSGRNNPSLDFILKMLAKYPEIEPDWLLFGSGEMYRSDKVAPGVVPGDSKEVLSPGAVNDLFSGSGSQKAPNSDESDESVKSDEITETNSVPGRQRIPVKVIVAALRIKRFSIVCISFSLS